MKPESLGDSTLDSFRAAAASGEPVPAGVAIAAVSGSFALGLLAKVVRIASRRKDFAGELSTAEQLASSADSQSKRMLLYARQDMEAFSSYIASAKLPNTTATQREERRRALDSAIRKTIETPVAAARAAAAGIGLCSKATDLVHSLVAADLGTAAALLSAALRVFLMCADSNLKLLAADRSMYRDLMTGRPELETNAFRQAQSALRRVTMAIEVAGSKRGAGP